MSRSLLRSFASFGIVAAVLTAGSLIAAESSRRVQPTTEATAQPVSEKSSTAQTVTAAKPVIAKPRNPRVLFITSKDTPQSETELARLRKPGGDFEKLRSVGWSIGTGPENNIQIVDRDEIPELVAKLAVKEYPTVACIDKDEVVRYFRWGCTTPLDMYTFGFLAKGIDERPKGAVMEAARVESTGSYPLRGNHWSVEGNWNPTRIETINHLRGPNHASELEAQWKIDSWSLEELRSLHDDLHERYDTGYRGPSDSGNSHGNGAGPDYLRFKGKS
jgi:hypothetical protein